MDLGASRLAQHSMRLVDGESCSASCADNMAALGVAKGGSTDDVDGGVATWWRPAEPCTCRSFAAACSAGGFGGAARQEAACGTLELRDERRSNVAMGPSPYGCVRMVAELLLGHQTPCMRLRTSSDGGSHSLHRRRMQLALLIARVATGARRHCRTAVSSTPAPSVRNIMYSDLPSPPLNTTTPLIPT